MHLSALLGTCSLCRASMKSFRLWLSAKSVMLRLKASISAASGLQIAQLVMIRCVFGRRKLVVAGLCMFLG